ncbi:MAG TPA: MFS transporter [Acidimicrobiales bacterium]|nr:MFS transporter [Acidimicrobiales bacterium]
MNTFTTGLKEGVDSVGRSFRNAPGATRKFLADPKSAVGGAAIAPLMVLVGHTFMDALDGAGFAVILPDIKKSFDLNDSQVASVGAMALFVGLLLSVPVAVKSEATTRRTLYLGAGAVIAAFFAFVSGIAGSLGLFLFARGGFGMGLRLNDPVQQSLLADYYPVHTRSTVFSARTGFERGGRLVGPVFFGLVTVIFGWRAALIAVAVPSAVLAYYSFKLKNPVRGAPEREAAGLAPIENEVIVNPPTFREAYRVLNRIGTVRRLWYSLPFIVGALLALAIMLPLLMEETFGLNAAERGFASASGEAAAIVGLLMTTPVLTRYLTSGSPEKVFPFLSALSVVLSVMLALTALSPSVAVLVLMIVLVNFTGALLAPALAVLISMVVPPRVRTIGFAFVALWVIPGLFILPIATSFGDQFGQRWTIALSAPMFMVGALILFSGARVFPKDVHSAMSALAADHGVAYTAPRPPARRTPRKPPPQPPARERTYSSRITPKQLAERHAQRTGARKKR